MSKKIIAIIPAKGNSTRVPKKNTAQLGGVPLIEWTLWDARLAGIFDEIYTSSDDDFILQLSNTFGESIKRPSYLCLNQTSSEDVVAHVLKRIDFKPDIIVMMQCTSPFRQPGILEKALDEFIEKEAESLVFGFPFKRFLWDGVGKPLNYDPFNRKMTQDIEDSQFIECGDYIFTYECFMRDYCRVSKNIDKRIVFSVPYMHSIDIDTPGDLDNCRAYVEQFNLSART
jgi:N-acylneuraminate cytidylyltransferase